MNVGPGGSLATEQVDQFRHLLMRWYAEHARKLPWRGVRDPYRTWVSEVMLQQTRVAAVIEHYERFLQLFPTLKALAQAPEADVLATWSGLGYYRRARMLHKAARFVWSEAGARIPETSTELRTLPGIGEYTCAAIASIAFGESIAVVDGNVERVLLRITGRPEEATAAARTFVKKQAATLVPARALDPNTNAAGDHNQAMMELGATICLPKSPLCLNCPVYSLCQTRGEHKTLPKGKQRSQLAAYLLTLRERSGVTEVLLERRDNHASLMPGMLELPPLPVDAVAELEPVLRVRHSITNTNYYVEIYAQHSRERRLRKAVVASDQDLDWYPVNRLNGLPITGLARKVLTRLDLMTITGLEKTRRAG